MTESAPAASPGSTTNFRLLGVISFAIGVAAVLMSRLLGLVTPLLLSTLPVAYGIIGGVGLIASVLSLVLGVGALALGLVVLLRRDAPKGFAAAGAALGGAEVLSAFIGFGQAAFFGFL